MSIFFGKYVMLYVCMSCGCPGGLLPRLIAYCIPRLSMVVGIPGARGGHCTTTSLLGREECRHSTATSQSKVSAKARAPHICHERSLYSTRFFGLSLKCKYCTCNPPAHPSHDSSTQYPPPVPGLVTSTSAGVAPHRYSKSYARHE